MKKGLFPALIILIGASFSVNVSAQEEPKKEVKKEVKEEVIESVEVNTEIETAELNTICPVSKEEVDPEITYEYKGKTYALCCKNCLRKFKKDPEKYIGRLEKEKEDKAEPK